MYYLSLTILSVTILSFGNPLRFDDIIPIEETAVPRDSFPTRCYKLLDPLAPFSSVARRNLCRKNSEKCGCSCQESCRRRQERIQTCCKAKGIKPGCLSMCRYELDTNEFYCNAKECADDLKPFVYCAADTIDASRNLDCCKANGIPEACHNLCRGEIPIRSNINIQLLPCLAKASKILQCHAANLPAETAWDKQNVNFSPQPEFEPWQVQILDSIATNACDDSSR